MSYPITGIAVESGAPTPLRMNICDFMGPGNEIQVSLFMQALASMQSKPFTDQLSYFRIAGLFYVPVVITRVGLLLIRKRNSWTSIPIMGRCPSSH